VTRRYVSLASVLQIVCGTETTLPARTSFKLAGAGTQKHRVIILIRSEQVSGVVADVVNCDEPGSPNLPLNAEVPLLEIGWLEIQRMRHYVRVSLKREIPINCDRKRITSGLVDPGVS
jgi:hypothetical protein